MNKMYYIFACHILLLYHLRKRILNYFSSYFTRIYYNIHGPVPQIHFLHRKRCGEIGPSECGMRPYSGGQSLTFRISEQKSAGLKLPIVRSLGEWVK